MCPANKKTETLLTADRKQKRHWLLTEATPGGYLINICRYPAVLSMSMRRLGVAGFLYSKLVVFNVQSLFSIQYFSMDKQIFLFYVSKKHDFSIWAERLRFRIPIRRCRLKPNVCLWRKILQEKKSRWCIL